MTWYCVKVSPGGLNLRHKTGEVWRGAGKPAPLGFPVEAILKRRGLDPFIPVESLFVRRDRFHLGAKLRVKRALLPGMLFLNLADPVNWLDVLSTPMLAGVFGVNGKPYVFDDDDINRLITISDDLRQPEYYRPMPTRRTYDAGDTVVDLTGIFDGEFQVVEIDGEVVTVLVPFFGDLRRITTRASALAKAG